MHHLDEMPGAMRAAMQIALFGGAFVIGSARCARRRVDAWRQRQKDRIEMFDNLFLTADHQAIPACLANYPSARAHIEIVDSFVFQLLRAADVVVIIRIAAIVDGIERKSGVEGKSGSVRVDIGS